MALYEYYCRSCGSTFELLRPMREAAAPATCPAGHTKAQRTVSLIARPAANGEAQPAAAGGCACGGGSCGCRA